MHSRALPMQISPASLLVSKLPLAHSGSPSSLSRIPPATQHSMSLPPFLRVVLGGFLMRPAWRTLRPVCTAESQPRWPEQCSGKVLSPGEAFSQVLPRSWARPLRLSWEAKSLLQCLVVPLAWHEAGREAFEGAGSFQSSSGSVGNADEKLLLSGQSAASGFSEN